MNELIFFGFAIFCLGLNLVALRMGKIYLYVLLTMYVLMMNIFVLKQFDLFGWAVTGGNVLYGAVFLGTDLLSEHFGKKEALKAVLIGFLASAFFVIATQVLLAYQPNDMDFAQDSLQTLFSLSPRILLGSMLAYLIAQTLDVWLFDRIKKFTKAKHLWLRNNASTLISQALDTVIFTAVGLTAFAGIPGVIPIDIFWEICAVTYAVKVLVSLIDTPFMYLSRSIKIVK